MKTHEYIRTTAEPPGSILRKLRRLYQLDPDDEFRLLHRYSGAPIRDWSIRLLDYELNTRDVAVYLRDYVWPWTRDPDYRNLPPEIFL
jgi:hypothetical protein